MRFESAQNAAMRLGCTVRSIQKWAKNGKIPYAYKEGRDWKIPTTAVIPEAIGKAQKVFTNEPVPIIHSYIPGKISEYIDSIKDEDDKNMTLCEYYYFIGEFEKSTLISERYIDSQNPILRAEAALFLGFANICRGHLVKTRYAEGVLKEELEKCFENNASNEIKAINVLYSSIVSMQLHLPFENIPLMKEYMKYLDEGVRLFTCYLTAYKAYLEKDYSKSLGIVETALNFSEEIYPLAMIYCYLMEAMALINLMKPKEALASLEKAWELAAPDGLLVPFVEHYSLLQGLIEKHFKKKHPDEFKKIHNIAKEYNSSWYRVYNLRNKQEVAANLTNTEFTIAMLYSRNWRVKEIAQHMELSERTISNYIAFIYEKLQINAKKELEKFMLK